MEGFQVICLGLRCEGPRSPDEHAYAESKELDTSFGDTRHIAPKDAPCGIMTLFSCKKAVATTSISFLGLQEIAPLRRRAQASRRRGGPDRKMPSRYEASPFPARHPGPTES